jgi:hypothetical protein
MSSAQQSTSVTTILASPDEQSTSVTTILASPDEQCTAVITCMVPVALVSSGHRWAPTSSCTRHIGAKPRCSAHRMIEGEQTVTRAYTTTDLRVEPGALHVIRGTRDAVQLQLVVWIVVHDRHELTSWLAQRPASTRGSRYIAMSTCELVISDAAIKATRKHASADSSQVAPRKWHTSSLHSNLHQTALAKQKSQQTAQVLLAEITDDRDNVQPSAIESDSGCGARSREGKGERARCDRATKRIWSGHKR